MILILSSDPVASALLGAWVETLGFTVRFARPPEAAEQSIRRVRPTVCLIDCENSAACSAETLGRAAMRRISVVIFGPKRALDRVRSLATDHDIDTLLMPPEASVLEATLERATLKASRARSGFHDDQEL